MHKPSINNSKGISFVIGSPGEEEIKQRSIMMEEVIAIKASFIERWSILIFLVMMLSIVTIFLYLFSYDSIQTNAILIVSNPLIELIPQQNSRVLRLFKHNNEIVEKNTILAWFVSSGSHEQVLDLCKSLDNSVSFLNNDSLKFNKFPLKKHYNHLGEVQQAYEIFLLVLEELNDFKNHGLLRKKQILEQEINSLKGKETLLLKQDYLAILHHNNIIKYLSNKEMIKEKKGYEITIGPSTLSVVQKRLNDKLTEFQNLNYKLSKIVMTLAQAKHDLLTSISDWEKKYILESPIEGKISFLVPIYENKVLEKGQMLGYVIPRKNDLIVQTFLPQNYFGAISIGAKVKLRFDAYPYQEMGFVPGTLNYISNVLSENGFFATIQLDQGFMTNTKKSIRLDRELKCQAFISTKTSSIITKYFHGS